MSSCVRSLIRIIGLQFNRTADAKRIVYLSAASMLQASREQGRSYFEIADVIPSQCAAPIDDHPQNLAIRARWPHCGYRHVARSLRLLCLNKSANRVLAEVAKTVSGWKTLVLSAALIKSELMKGTGSRGLSRC
jgi:hypothetical protein